MNIDQSLIMKNVYFLWQKNPSSVDKQTCTSIWSGGRGLDTSPITQSLSLRSQSPYLCQSSQDQVERKDTVLVARKPAGTKPKEIFAQRVQRRPSQVQPPSLLSSQRQTEPIGSKRRRRYVAGEVVQNRPLWLLSTNERPRFCKLGQSEQGKRRGGKAQNIQGSHEVSLHPKQGPVPAHRQHLKRELEELFLLLNIFGTIQ